MTEDEEPRFGEVWKWNSIGPVMALGLRREGENTRIECIMLEPNEPSAGQVLELIWDGNGSFRNDWHRIDEGENS